LHTRALATASHPLAPAKVRESGSTGWAADGRAGGQAAATGIESLKKGGIAQDAAMTASNSDELLCVGLTGTKEGALDGAVELEILRVGHEAPAPGWLRDGTKRFAECEICKLTEP
jgi:hypothetical protein